MKDDVRKRVADEILTHPAVAGVFVPEDSPFEVYLEPDPDAAPVLWRACALESEGALKGLTWHEPANDLRVAQINPTETDFLYEEVDIYLRHGLSLPERAVVVDAGANIGMFSLLAARRSPGARILAIEPVTEAAHAVTVNAKLHGADVTVLAQGLGSRTDEMDFVLYPNNIVMSSFYADVDLDRGVLRDYMLTGKGAEDIPQLDDMVEDRMTARRRRCPVTTLSEVVAAQGIDVIDLLKIDVEKAEADVLAGIDTPTWSKVKQIVLEVHDIDGRLAKVCALLSDLGFRTSHAQDRRLSAPTHFTVYGRRESLRVEPSREAPGERWPTLRALRRDLEIRLSRKDLPLPPPERFVLVRALSSIGRAPGLARSAPSSPAIAVLTELWALLFGTAAVRDDADFFELGADSLTAVRFLADIEARLGEDVLPPDAIFTNSRFGELARALDAGVSA